MKVPKLLGETTITGRNQVSLPAKGVREMGWDRGDRLLVESVGDDILVLIRRPHRYSEAFAGRLTEVFGTHEENLRFLEELRKSWDVS